MHKYFSLPLQVRLLFLVISFSNVSTYAQPVNLFTDGKSKFEIYIASSEKSKYKAIANDLQSYLMKVGQVKIPIVNKYSDTFQLVIGDSKDIADRASIYLNKLGDQEFQLKSHNSLIFIIGRNPEAVRNGVYFFLEKHVGVKYMSANHIHIPSLKKLDIPFLNNVHGPSFSLRYLYYGPAFNEDYAKFNLITNNTGSKNFFREDFGLSPHSINDLLNLDLLKSQNPRALALFNGKRTTDNACFSNILVRETVINRIGKLIRQNPNIEKWMVSQSDNMVYCQCDECEKMYEKEGSKSATIINLVNSVAREYQNKTIATLAYKYSRTPPQNLKIEKNVLIIMSTIECDRSIPLSEDKLFVSDLDNWLKKTSNIMIWDYVVNFSNLLMPFPNMDVLQPNMKFLYSKGVREIFNQGWYGKGGDMEELRSYIVAKLMWDVNADVKTLTTDFLKSFYGSGWSYVQKYIKALNSNLRNSSDGLKITDNPNTHRNGYLSEKNIRQYEGFLNYALEASSGVYDTRIQNLFQGIRYVNIYRGDNKQLRKFVQQAKNNETTYVQEGGKKLEDFVKENQMFSHRKSISNLAEGKTVRYITHYSKLRNGIGDATLTDGVIGNTDWYKQTTWQGFVNKDMIILVDMGKKVSFSSINSTYLSDNRYLIFLPELVEYSVSDDGKNFKLLKRISNSSEGVVQTRKVVDYEYKGQKTVARYIKVHAKIIKSVPSDAVKWKTATNNSPWIMCDEVYVY